MRNKFKEITRKVYVDQAKCERVAASCTGAGFLIVKYLRVSLLTGYLNAFWPHGAEKEAEEIWKTTQKFIEQDKKKKQGNELNEVEAHRELVDRCIRRC